ncbi:T9SS type A sorting domain-containing protein [Hymenobacter chitinivorans]|uniref:Putative secreted protein (Por secretion system target) n=1 Tax=Hymenobacter chitinivorans DSM 11115 TaxID=1121954 RepID=A0A2M9AQA4_9BACT|nr:T9SS type A sorting domain-containing protein [Hymenobacter chitinivorans]PJJ47823.1 putative secreted protein (Por secretion system target) [Hymenobacter chitinivorans DSM 11115]
MKKSLLLLLSCLTWTLAQAQYRTPGTGVRWTLAQLTAASGGYVTTAGGTIQVNDTIRLSARDTLEIRSNATIKMASLALFYVDGVLLINPRDSVKITAADPTKPFHSFWFSATSEGSELHKTVVEYGGGLKVVDASLVLDSCVVRYQVSAIGTKATNSGAISLSGGTPRITNCRIYGNARSGILSPSNRPTSPIIRNNVLVANSTENGNWPQINLGIGGATPIIIQGNLVVGRYLMAGGISVSNLLGTSAVSQVQIRRNIVRNNRYGIAIVGGNISSYITQNIISDNNINPNAQTGGSGLNFNGTQTQTGVVSRNIIRGNLYGVTLQRSNSTTPAPRVSFGDLSSTDTTNVGRNLLTGNGNGGQIYDIYNNTAESFKAENNDWGTSFVTEIESHIYHQPDNAALGLVDYLPFRNTVLAARPAQALTTAVYPNPATSFLTFELGKSTAPAELRVYDLAGRVVATYAAKPMQGRLVFSTRGLATGLYTYRLTQESATTAGKFAVAW